MLRIAIIGVGWAGTRQAQAITELNQSEFSGKVALDCLVDSDAAFLQTKCDQFNITKCYTDLENALADTDVDAVSICLPHALHCDAAIASANAGKHILCEKPLALTVAEATRMIDAADANGVKLYVAESQVYTPRAELLRQIVRSQQYIGELTFATMKAGFRAQNFGYDGRRAWLARPEQGGTGTWVLHGIHSMAEVRYIFGDIETVHIQEHKASSYRRTELEGTISGLLTLANGVHLSFIQTSETALPFNLKGYELHGDQGSIRAANNGYEIFPAEPKPTNLPPVHSYPEAELSAYALEIAAFADYVVGTSTGPTTGRSERKTLAIIEAGYYSMRSGQPVNLQEYFGDLP